MKVYLHFKRLHIEAFIPPAFIANTGVFISGRCTTKFYVSKLFLEINIYLYPSV